MERGKKAILGIDIGGSKIRFLYGGKFKEFSTPKTKRGFIDLIKKFPRADKVGISVAGVVNGTRVKISPNIKYLKNFDFRKIFKRVKVDNDARCFLRAEIRWLSHYLVAKPPSKIFGITIGTGIGRAFSGKKIKSFEYPERWEKEYQKIRDSKDDQKLARYLGVRLNLIIKKYRSNSVILGGGVLGRKGFFEMLKKRLSVEAIKARFGIRAGAIGAAMLWN
ncbi:MAG: hypothetical protein UX24_C0016G0007 [Candidatus Giovannonibacteria bacterium GW2011_GWB1_45_9b]|uniref:ROK family protein n=4 Tax=Candidatus Giovannoniibacteriota TaxID=1752738 RepID=A0A1F5X2K1_9BACT|nr:MAG: hypothetical protein UX24_C0016G0007 [Candidatus Giovannonibacteria bacterium GW2011_GWB1_45_9b]OGF73532.1 MAG: hypothetical protein A2W57_03510 [Candidatus Giovannonibacteria bacterium RIFCSPHIGHO2_02_43_16]OGF81791.1 MAG: hypothetical protein A2W48_00230 [Candidatus Giovannonibacteria bacterium RIFCSPHIGHO2_12_44_12]OGF86043.1 MAG: hypothetical protein A2Z63_03205 [Candidatus Giovannonibacteria bacterium RIFCSPLOWO2_02_44_8]